MMGIQIQVMGAVTLAKSNLDINALEFQALVVQFVQMV